MHGTAPHLSQHTPFVCVCDQLQISRDKTQVMASNVRLLRTARPKCLPVTIHLAIAHEARANDGW